MNMNSGGFYLMTCRAENAPGNFLHFPHPCGSDTLMSRAHGRAGATLNELEGML